jgi:LuxR family transcriptional regulator, maltose regulon positive regulatory protein
VLDRLCAPLCDALLVAGDDPPDSGSVGGDSQEILKELERTNLFLMPLDDERVWYRYHHPLAERPATTPSCSSPLSWPKIASESREDIM